MPDSTVAISRQGEFLRLDVGEAQQAHLLECYSGAQFRLSTMARTVLEMRWCGAPFEEIADRLRDDDIVNTSAASVAEYFAALQEKIESAGDGKRKSDASYLVRFTLFPQALVRGIAAIGQHLFAPVTFAIALACLTFAIAVWALAPQFKHHVAFTDLAIAYGLFLFSLVIHEFGHASACERFGSRPGSIGFTLYLTFPALFSDVSSAWRLRRWQRVMVDAGGSYFQLLVGSAYAVAYLLTHWLPLHVAVLMIVGTTVFNLNPLFKFDGYWIVADALGVTNLSRQTFRIVRAARARLTGEIVDPLPWPSWTIGVLCVYSVASIAAWSYFLFRLGGALVRQVSFTAHTLHLVAVGSERFDGTLAVQFGLSAFGFAVSVYFVSRLAMRIAPQLIRTLRRSRAADAG